ncbi:MAG TPA: ATP-binding protein [Verrucomicrobiae bacterium]
MKLDLQATMPEVMRAVEALQKFTHAQGIPDPIAFGLALALEECGTNVVKHAYRSDARQSFQVSFKRLGDEVVIELHDRGPEFDPTTAPARERRIHDEDTPGGWGIDLVKHYMDRIEYRREAGQNILRLHKRLVMSGHEA